MMEHANGDVSKTSISTALTSFCHVSSLSCSRSEYRVKMPVSYPEPDLTIPANCPENKGSVFIFSEISFSDGGFKFPFQMEGFPGLSQLEVPIEPSNLNLFRST